MDSTEGVEGSSAAGVLVPSRMDRQRARNRLAQRRHRERKRLAEGHGTDHGRASSLTAEAEHNEWLASGVTTSHHSAPTLPGQNFRPMATPSSWDGSVDFPMPGVHDPVLTDLSHLQPAEGPPIPPASRFAPESTTARAGVRKEQPAGADFVRWVDGDYWPQTYPNGPHDIWASLTGKPMAAMQRPPAAVPSVAPYAAHAHRKTRTDRAKSFSDGDLSSPPASPTYSSSPGTSTQQAFPYTPLSLARDHDAGQGRRNPKVRANELVPQRLASAKAISAATPVSIGGPRGPRRGSTALSDGTDEESLEARLERVLNVVEDNGFDSIDAMTSAYYTSDLAEDSFLHPMQATSRSRRLRGLLADLEAAHKSWPRRERSAYAEEVVRSAEAICSAELGALYPAAREQQQQQQRQQSASLQPRRSEIARRIREVLSAPDLGEFLQRDQAALRNAVPETWSMIVELARKAGLQPHERAMAACINIYLLTDHHSP